MAVVVLVVRRRRRRWRIGEERIPAFATKAPRTRSAASAAAPPASAQNAACSSASFPELSTRPAADPRLFWGVGVCVGVQVCGALC